MRESTRGLRDRLEVCGQTVLEARHALQDEERLKKDKQSELERLQEKFVQLAPPGSAVGAPLQEREEALRKWGQRQHQSDITQQQSWDLQAQADAVSAQVVACEAEIASTGAQRELSVWALVGIGSVFLALSLVAAFEQEFFLTIIAGTAGIVVVGLLSWWRHDLRAQRRSHVEELRQKYQDVAEEALAGLREKTEEVRKRVGLAEQAQEEAQAAWTRWLTGLNLPPELTPEGVLEVMADAERAQGQLREWRDVTQELEQVERVVQETMDQLNRVLEQCGMAPVSVQDAPVTLLNLRKEIELNLSRQQDLIHENEVMAEKRAELESAEAEKMRCLEQREALLQAGGALDAESFRRRADVYARRVELERDQRQLETALRVRAGSSEQYQEMEQALSMQSRAELEHDLGELERDSQRLGEELPGHCRRRDGWSNGSRIWNTMKNSPISC